ncbi:hypothetical protein Pcinc_034336 [Petrolisthes cinctipes]|uniref:Uncharacterized protein n=1 Tax=Petrolisthes cinctipes TaxID=88211 RepID=A0AAE1EQI2_PETCI|nr:hypothetical protein Pcinc_034336 [Petrolisthes cinctipes]
MTPANTTRPSDSAWAGVTTTPRVGCMTSDPCSSLNPYPSLTSHYLPQPIPTFLSIFRGVGSGGTLPLHYRT